MSMEYESPRERFRRLVKDQFERMEERARFGVQSDCFWILDTQRPGDAETGMARAFQSKPLLVGARVGEMLSTSASPPYFDGAAPGEEEGVSFGGRPPSRYVQFLFYACRPYFVLDLPTATIEPIEARILRAKRDGFFLARDLPAIRYSSRVIEEFDPVCKQYVNGDQESATSDLAYLLFDLWRLPVTSKLYVTASAFEGRRRCFENGVLLEDLDALRRSP